jgi:hypothetical protein
VSLRAGHRSRGVSTCPACRQVYFDNVREELDFPGEWFLDAGARVLYYVANGTKAPPADGFIAGQLENIISVVGTRADPVVNVTISGLTFAYSEPT